MAAADDATACATWCRGCSPRCTRRPASAWPRRRWVSACALAVVDLMPDDKPAADGADQPGDRRSERGTAIARGRLPVAARPVRRCQPPGRGRVRYLDETGARHEVEADGLLAACLQHEIDHLDGVLFVDHLSVLKRNMIMRRLAKEMRQKARTGDGADAPRLHGQPGFRRAGAAGAARGGARDRRRLLPAAAAGGRGQARAALPGACGGRALGLPVRTPARLRRDPAEHAAFAALGLDAAVVAAYGLILPQPMLEAPRRGCLNIHASLLPRWRGAAPIQAAILAGDARNRHHHHADGCRAGHRPDAAARGRADRRRAPPPPTLHDALAAIGARLILRALAEHPAPRAAARGGRHLRAEADAARTGGSTGRATRRRARAAGPRAQSLAGHVFARLDGDGAEGAGGRCRPTAARRAGHGAGRRS